MEVILVLGILQKKDSVSLFSVKDHQVLEVNLGLMEFLVGMDHLELRVLPELGDLLGLREEMATQELPEGMVRMVFLDLKDPKDNQEKMEQKVQQDPKE